MKKAAVTLLVLAALSGCASAQRPTAKPVALPACQKLPDAVLPHAAGMLTEQQSGTYCLPRGQRADIFLSAVQGSAWQAVRTSTDGVLTPTGNSMMTAPMGVTVAMFVGATDGVTKITSQTASGKSWTATLVVKG